MKLALLSSEAQRQLFYSQPEMARKNSRDSLPPVHPLEDDANTTIYDSDFSSEELESGRNTRQNSRFSFTKPRKVSAPSKQHPYLSSLANKNKKGAKANGIIRQDSESIMEKAKSQRRLKLHELQNEIQSLLIKQKDLENENKLLKRTQRRQTIALKRYEGHEGELPSLIRSHEEEVRTLRELLRKATEKQRFSEKRENEKTIELEKARVQLHRLQGIVREQHLDERIVLNKKVDALHTQLEEKEKKTRELQHHLDLRDKNYKHQLAIEFARHKETKKKLHEAQIRIDKLSVSIKEKDRELEIRNIYTAHIGTKSSPTRKPVTLSPARKTTKDIKKLTESISKLELKEEEMKIDRDSTEINNYFFPNTLDNLQLKQRNVLPSIEPYKQLENTETLTPPQEYDLTQDKLENQENLPTISLRQSFSVETCSENFLKSPQRQSISQQVIDHFANSVRKQSQEIQIWITSSRPQSRQDSRGSNQIEEEEESPLVSAKSKKSDLMRQLFGELDDGNAVDSSENCPDLEFKSLGAGVSHSESGALLSRRPREKSNTLPKQATEILEEETNPLFLI